MPASTDDTAAPSRGPSFLLALAVVAAALPLTLGGLMGFVGHHEAVFKAHGAILTPLTQQVIAVRDAGLVAGGLGGALLGILGAIFLPGTLRTGIAVFVILLLIAASTAVFVAFDLPMLKLLEHQAR